MYLPPHRSSYTPTTKMTSHGSIIHQNKLVKSVGTPMLNTVPGMTKPLQKLEGRRITTGWKHTKMMVQQREPQGVNKVLESVRRMSRWWILLGLNASHGRSFQNSAQTNSRCSLSGVRILRWSVTMPEGAPTTSKQIGISSTNASITVYMR